MRKAMSPLDVAQACCGQNLRNTIGIVRLADDTIGIEVDWHGVVADGQGRADLGKPIPGAVNALLACRKAGLRVRIACRGLVEDDGDELRRQMEAWLVEHVVPHGYLSDFEFTGQQSVDKQIEAMEFPGDWITASDAMYGMKHLRKVAATAAFFRLIEWESTTMKAIKSNRPIPDFDARPIPTRIAKAVQDRLDAVTTTDGANRTLWLRETFVTAAHELQKAMYGLE